MKTTVHFEFNILLINNRFTYNEKINIIQTKKYLYKTVVVNNFIFLVFLQHSKLACENISGFKNAHFTKYVCIIIQ